MGFGTISAVALASVACIAAREADPEIQRREYTDRIMGTGARVVLYATSGAVANRAAEAAFARMRELERALSDWNPSSELAQLCRRAGDGPVAISDDLFRNLELALGFALDSSGVLDPTIAPLVALWRESRSGGALPSSAALAAARELCGWHRVTLDHRARTAELERGTRLDLGASPRSSEGQLRSNGANRR